MTLVYLGLINQEISLRKMIGTHIHLEGALLTHAYISPENPSQRILILHKGNTTRISRDIATIRRNYIEPPEEEVIPHLHHCLQRDAAYVPLVTPDSGPATLPPLFSPHEKWIMPP